MTTASPIIDTHQHAFWHGRSDHGLIEDMDLHGISTAWLLTWEIPPYCQPTTPGGFHRVLNPAALRPDNTHPGILLHDLLQAHRSFPGRFILGYCPDPMQPRAPDLFHAACDMYGVKVCGEWKFSLLLDDPRCIELFRAAGERKAPVVLHLDLPYLPPNSRNYVPRWYGGTIGNLERALAACPDTNFIGHAPGFWRELSADASERSESYPEGPSPGPGLLAGLLDRYPNLYADLSAESALRALKRDRGYTAEFLELYQSRMLFGRDRYGSDLFDFLQTLKLSLEATAAIYRQNALRLLGGAGA